MKKYQKINRKYSDLNKNNNVTYKKIIDVVKVKPREKFIVLKCFYQQR